MVRWRSARTPAPHVPEPLLATPVSPTISASGPTVSTPPILLAQSLSRTERGLHGFRTRRQTKTATLLRDWPTPTKSNLHSSTLPATRTKSTTIRLS